MDKPNAEKIKKTSMLLVLMLSIGGTIAGLNFIQTFIISRTSRIAILEDEMRYYDEIIEAYSLASSEMFVGYQKELDYYVDADIMQTGEFSEMVEWLRAHESKRSADFDYIMLIDGSGKAYTDIGTETDVSSRAYFKAVMKEGKDQYIGDPVISKTTGQSVVHITRAVKRGGRTIAAIAGVLNIKQLTDVFNSINVGESGYAWVLASDGTVISHPVKDFIMKKNFITDSADSKGNISEIAKKIVTGEKGEEWLVGANNETDLVLHSGIKGTTWALVISVPKKEIYNLVNSMRNTLIIFGTVIVIVSIVVGALILYFAIKPLKIVEGTITGIASGNADLTQRIDVNSNNEIGNLVKGFNKFIQKLQDIISDVKDSKNELSLAGEDMSASAQDTSTAITQIIANIENMHRHIDSQSESVHQTAGAVNEIASNITSLETMIESQSSGVTQASAAVEEMIGNIKSVNQSVDKMASSFNSLRDDAQKGFNKQQDVNERIHLIESQSEMLQEANAAISAIAEQTNLLAMNAAIEAAHAGEAGKGFSVVADEIRKLSETSTSQSKTIGEQLNNIKDSIQEVVLASNESSQAFESVSRRIQDTDQLVMQIKAAMEEQNTGSQQISDALHTMNDSTIQVRNASQEMTEGNKAILEEVKNLQNATGAMKDGMAEMSIGARKINETGAALNDISSKVEESIKKIGSQIDLFKV